MKTVAVSAGRRSQPEINGSAARTSSCQQSEAVGQEEDEGADEEEGDGLPEEPVDPQKGLAEDVRQPGEAYRGDLQYEIGLLAGKEAGGCPADQQQLKQEHADDRQDGRDAQ